MNNKLISEVFNVAVEFFIPINDYLNAFSTAYVVFY